MANENNGGTAGPVEVEIDLKDPAVATRFAGLGQVCELYLGMFAPAFIEKLTPETFQGFVLGLFREELMIDAQVRPLFMPDSAKENPNLIIQLEAPGGREPPVRFGTKRRFEHCKNVQEILACAMAIAFTDAPGLRAVLRAYGFSYMWLAPTTSRIVLAKG